MCPGWIKTRLGSDRAPDPPEVGANAIIFLVKDQSGISGKFWSECEVTDF